MHARTPTCTHALISLISLVNSMAPPKLSSPTHWGRRAAGEAGEGRQHFRLRKGFSICAVMYSTVLVPCSLLLLHFSLPTLTLSTGRLSIYLSMPPLFPALFQLPITMYNCPKAQKPRSQVPRPKLRPKSRLRVHMTSSNPSFPFRYIRGDMKRKNRDDPGTSFVDKPQKSGQPCSAEDEPLRRRLTVEKQGTGKSRKSICRIFRILCAKWLSNPPHFLFWRLLLRGFDLEALQKPFVTTVTLAPVRE